MADNHKQYFDKPDFVALFTAIRQKNIHAPVEWIIDQYNDHQNSLIDNSAKDVKPPKKQPKK